MEIKNKLDEINKKIYGLYKLWYQNQYMYFDGVISYTTVYSIYIFRGFRLYPSLPPYRSANP